MAKKSSQGSVAKKSSKADAPAKKAKPVEKIEKKAPAKKAAPEKAPAEVKEKKKAAAPAAVESDTQEAAPEVAAPAKKAKKPTAAQLRAEQALSDELARWQALQTQHGKVKAPTYKMSEQFEAGTPVSHPRLGWGFVLSKLNDRLEVIFESGIKILISNYKG